MSEFNIEVQGGSSVRLPTAGKYCEKDIIVTASGGGGTEELENIIDQSGVLDSTDGTATEKVEQVLLYADVARKRYEGRANEIVVMPSMDYSLTTSLNGAFMGYANLENIQGEINCSKNTALNNFCNGCSKLKSVKLSNTNNVSSWGNAFRMCSLLETLGLLDCSNSSGFGQAFQACVSLKNIEFVAETIKLSITIPSPVLSDESIQSITDGLNSEVTGQTLTIPRAAVKKAFETSEGANDGDTSETWNALVASKPNWTITLS